MPSRITLRRSCQGCIKAKRKCDMQTPSCGRCKTRKLRCVFDNEPLTNKAPPATTYPTPAPSPMAVRSMESMSRWEVCPTVDSDTDSEHDDLPKDAATILHDLNSAIPANKVMMWDDYAWANRVPCVTDPALHFMRPSNTPMILTLDDATTRYMLQTLRTFPTSYADHGKSLFIHPRLMRELPINRIAAKIFSLCRWATRLKSSMDRQAAAQELELRVQELINHTNRTRPPIQGLLVSVQALMLSQITLGLGNLSDGRADARTLAQRSKDLKLLGQWSYQLWCNAPWVLPNATSPSQSWLFGESVRRTLIMAHLVTDTFAVLCTGKFRFTGFVSTLPFDSRTGLWEDLEGPPEGMEVDGFGAGKSSLLSFRQLVIRFEDGVLTPKDVGGFERLLLVACRGYQMVMNRVGLPLGGTWYPTVDQTPGWEMADKGFQESLMPEVEFGTTFT